MLSKIPGSRFAATFPDSNERTNLAVEFDINNRQARGSWVKANGRTQILRIYLFGKIGSGNALETFHDAAKDGLLELYEGGISGTEEDGNEGINDFLLARTGTSYENDGLVTRNYGVIDGSGDTLADVAEAMVEITNNGIY
jgi:hypothetical protein